MMSIENIIQMWNNNKAFAEHLKGYMMTSLTSLLLYILSGAPYIGKLVFPGVSFYSFNRVVGTPTASLIFLIGTQVPRRWMATFMACFWGGRSLVRELLIPYFSRLPFSSADKNQWFRTREGIMFGFGSGFYLLLKIPYIGVLIYGIAEASSAYLITKVSDPPPATGGQVIKWTEAQTVWTTEEVLLSGQTLDDDGFGSSIPGAFLQKNK